MAGGHDQISIDFQIIKSQVSQNQESPPTGIVLLNTIISISTDLWVPNLRHSQMYVYLSGIYTYIYMILYVYFEVP